MLLSSWLKLGRWTALLSFTGATLLLWWFERTRLSGVLSLGALFLLVMGGLSLGVGVALLGRLRSAGPQRPGLLLTLGLMLLNLPVAAYYDHLLTRWLNTIELTLINAATSPLTGLRATGCAALPVPDLAPGDSTTLTFRIPADCSLYVRYHRGGQLRQETVIGYATNNLGGRFRRRLAAGTYADQRH